MFVSWENSPVRSRRIPNPRSVLAKIRQKYEKINNSSLEAVTQSLCIEWDSAIFKTFFKVFI